MNRQSTTPPNFPNPFPSKPEAAGKSLYDSDEPLALTGCLPAPHPAAADGRQRCRQFLQRAAGTRSHHCCANKGAHQPDLPGGQEVFLWVCLPVHPSLFNWGCMIQTETSITMHKIIFSLTVQNNIKQHEMTIIERNVDTKS